MEYEKIRELKQSEKSRVQLIREKSTGEIYVRKVLQGRHEVYEVLQGCPHPFLPVLYEVNVSDEETEVIEEYIEEERPDLQALSGRAFRGIVRELCTVLEFLHGKGIIHRDIKPSNILMAKDGHIRLIDFDAARMPKEELEQDTRLLGTRGYAPPEQYGFAQTDERADIYSLGMTMEQLLGDKKGNYSYRRIIRKCTRLDPDERYQSVRQVRRAFFALKWIVLSGVLAVSLLILAVKVIYPYMDDGNEEVLAENAELQTLPAPENPRWDGESGIGLWGIVSESGVPEGSIMEYKWKLYRSDTEDPPKLEEDVWEWENTMSGNIWRDVDGVPVFEMNFSEDFQENGFYYFAVAAVGDGVSYMDSPYVVSDAFEYTGEDAPPLPSPTGLEWKILQSDDGWVFLATWENLEDYTDADSFNVTVYDKNNEYVFNNIWSKEQILEQGQGGIRIRREFLSQKDGAYRFTVQALSSRPNEYKSSLMPDPVPEEYFSPWYYD